MKSSLGQKRQRLSLAALSLCIIMIFGSSCGLLNNDPIICSLEVEKDWVTTSGGCEVRCVASDPDGDEITYLWTATSGNISGQGSTVTWTAPETSGTYVITVTVTDSRNSETSSQLTMDVRVNHPPVIASLTAERLVANRAESIIIECVASDTDRDNLTYTWSATGGAFSGTGPITAWMAPRTLGTYTITIQVTDGRGGKATRQLTIDVMVNHSPVIESLIAEHSVVKEGESTPIECVASDPDGDKLSYLWAATDGLISGEGPAVIWTAPDTCQSYVVTVTVFDDRGSETSGELNIRVRKPG